jgi:hypothetical protein
MGTSSIDDGELSHEDTVGEVARNRHGFALDYKMIDTTFLLMSVSETLMTSGEPFTDELLHLLDTKDYHGISGREKLTRNPDPFCGTPNNSPFSRRPSDTRSGICGRSSP